MSYQQQVPPQSYYQQQPPQGYYTPDQSYPYAQQGYAQQPPPVVYVQQPPEQRSNNDDCITACIASLCVCASVNLLLNMCFFF